MQKFQLEIDVEIWSNYSRPFQLDFDLFTTLFRSTSISNKRHGNWNKFLTEFSPDIDIEIRSISGQQFFQNWHLSKFDVKIQSKISDVRLIRNRRRDLVEIQSNYSIMNSKDWFFFEIDKFQRFLLSPIYHLERPSVSIEFPYQFEIDVKNDSKSSWLTTKTLSWPAFNQKSTSKSSRMLVDFTSNSKFAFSAE